MKTKAKFLPLARLGLLLTLAASNSHSLWSQTIVNLTQDATVRTAGTYTYYARGNAAGTTISPFTTAFYPGASLHSLSGGTDNGLVDSGSNGAAISVGSGYLTDNKTSTSVSGWIDIEQVTSGSATASHNGSFDILFDLGSAYTITSVVITYTDASGKRWATTESQLVFTSLTQPTSDASLTSFASANVTSGSTNGTMTFDGTDITARYVDLRLDMVLSPNVSGGSAGGVITEVAIYGYAVPEPSTWALVGLGLVMLYVGKRRLIWES